MTIPHVPDSPESASRFDVGARLDGLATSARDGVLDAASARDLAVFLEAVHPVPGATLQRPVAVWRGDTRYLVDVIVTTAADGSMRIDFGDDRPDATDLDEPEVVDARLEELDTMVWVTDADRLARFFNRAWLDFTGTTLADDLGWGWMQHVHPDDLNGMLTTYERAQQEQRGFEFVGRLASWDRDWWWVRARATPRRIDQSFQGFLGICEVISRAREGTPPDEAGVAELLPVADWEHEAPAAVASRLARLAAALDVTRPAEPFEVTLLRRLASRWLGQHVALADRHDDVVLAVGEAAANSALHAYPDQAGRVQLTCALAPAHAEFRVRDWGRWQEPRAERDSRGIIMMRALTDDCAINHLADGTEVILRFAL
jgi:PAS domain S-box-containing protein